MNDIEQQYTHQALVNLSNRLHILETKQLAEPTAFEALGNTGAGIALTITVTDVPDAEMVLVPGVYLVIGEFEFTAGGAAGANDDGYLAEGSLRVNNTTLTDVARTGLAQLLDQNSVVRASRTQVTQCWLLTLWDYRQYVIVDNPTEWVRLHELNTIASPFVGSPIPAQPPAIGVTDLNRQPTYSMLFDGADDYYATFAGDFYVAEGTIEIWFKTSAAVVQHLVGNLTPSPPSNFTGRGAAMYVNAAGNVVAGLRTAAGAEAAVSSPLTYKDGAWHHAVMTWDATTLILYIDGTQVVSAASVTPSHGGAPATSNLAADPAGANKFNGYLDEAASYTSMFTASRVKIHYDAGLGVIHYPSTLYADDVLADLPVLWWRFNDASAPGGIVAIGAAEDSSGNNRNGTYVLNVALAQEGAIMIERDGTYNDALRIRGAIGGYVFRNNEAALQIAAGTYEIWFRNTTSGTIQHLMGNGRLDPAAYGVTMALNATGQFIGQVADAASNVRVTSPRAYNDGKWHHAVMTWDGATVRLYIDGDEVASGAYALTVAWNAYSFHIGVASTGTQYWYTGWLDEATVYDSVLSAARIKQHYLSGYSNRAWLTLAVRKTGGTGTSQLVACKLTAIQLAAASRS